MNCNTLLINEQLDSFLKNLTNPCDMYSWISHFEKIQGGSVGVTFKVYLKNNIPFNREYYILKKQQISTSTTIEKNILKIISEDMKRQNAPLLFPYLYIDYVCNNDIYMLMQPALISLEKILRYKVQNINWWVTFLYQISKAIYYLEEKNINHNDLTYENIMFQNLTDNYNDMVIMIIDFGSAVINNVKGFTHFTIGRDLNYFLYMLIYDGVPKGYFPKDLADKLHPFLVWNDIPYKGEIPYDYGLKRVNISQHNPNTSGKFISRFLSLNFPFVTEKCKPQNIEKIFGLGFGAIIGDILGTPFKQDHNNIHYIDKIFSPSFFKRSNSLKLEIGSFTDSKVSICLIKAIMTNDRQIIPSSVIKELKHLLKDHNFLFDKYIKSILKNINNDNNNWKQVVKDVNKKSNIISTSALLRAWPIAILYHNLHYKDAIEASILQAKITDVNKDIIYSSVFLVILIHSLLNDMPLDDAIEKATSYIKRHITKNLLHILTQGHNIKYEKLKSEHNNLYNTMNIIIWCIKNTYSFKDALLKAVNIKGDTTINTSLTGTIAGALYGFNNIPYEWVETLNNPNKNNIVYKEQITELKLKEILLTLAQC